ncbi:hypothetical protein BY458DRAFT_535922 [Sporodiniella umbellata]|nr:hypothetical protein BY458DRAFT_535922 [Sporodiniella umbellata]
MRISQLHSTEAAQAEACVEWINSIDGISRHVSYITELSDGIVLFEVLSTIDFKWFRLIRSADVGDNWVFKINNLKKIYKLISRYYEEVLGFQFSKLPVINLTLIAKESDPYELFKLCQLVIHIAVLCTENERYIQKIQQMPPTSQQHLMHLIDQIMKTSQEESPLDSLQATSRDSYTEENTSYQSELVRVSKERQELGSQNEQLITNYSELLKKYDVLKEEKQDLKARLKELESAAARADETGIADLVMRTEMEHLKQDLLRSEDVRQGQERMLEEQVQKIKQLMRRSVDAEKFEEQVILEERNHTLMEHSQKVEDEYGSLIAFKSLMESYKDQVAELQTQTNELIREKNRIEYNLAISNKKIVLMEEKKESDQNRIQALEDRLMEFQLKMGPTTKEPQQDDVDLEDLDLNGSLEDGLKETNVTELKLANRRLERQVKKFQEDQASGKNQKAVILQHLLDDANRLKTQFEKSYITVSQERDILQSDMAQIRKGISDALLDQSSLTLPLRLHSLDLEKEIQVLNGIIEAKVYEGRHGKEDTESISAKYVEINQKSKQLEKENKSQLENVNRLLTEKDALQYRHLEQNEELREQQRINSEIKISLATFAGQQSTVAFEDPQHVAQTEKRLKELELKLKKAKEFIKQQDKMLKESDLNTLSEGATALSKSDVALCDEENAKLTKQIYEMRIQSRREQQLIMSAWYSISRKVYRELPVSKPLPQSWLGQQRFSLDSQLKRH